MRNGIGNDNPASPTIVWGVLVSELKSLKARSITRLQLRIIPDMNAGDVTLAVRLNSYWKNDCRADKVHDLNAGVVIAVSKSRHFHQAREIVTVCLELSSKNGMRDIGVCRFVPAVGNDKSLVVDGLQILLEG